MSIDWEWLLDTCGEGLQDAYDELCDSAWDDSDLYDPYMDERDEGL